MDGQVGLLAHDIGHLQVLRGRWKNIIGGLIFDNLLLGMSEEWWISKHNCHHGHPNHLDHDPDIDVPFIAFTEEPAFGKRGIPRFIVRHQRYFYLPVTALLGLSPRNLSIRFLLRKEASRPWLEVTFLAAHFRAVLRVAVYSAGRRAGCALHRYPPR
ncbi:MAG TPA: fatty acid desaturase, partial [Chloroflexota bacterium]|nr:fatty acid desaturase [Chloroflexota bacterium]